MTAAEYQALSAATEQALLRGLVAAAETFDYDAPLPPLRILPREQIWEPAARRYRDLTEAEKAEQNAPRFEADK